MFTTRFGRKAVSCLALALVALFLTLVLTHAGRAKPRPAPRPGSVSIEVTDEGIKLGNYATSINIHNPSPIYTVNLYKKAVVDAIGPSKFTSATLYPDYAVEINCTDVVNLYGDTPPASFPFIKGFVVIFAKGVVTPGAAPVPLPLDVVGVYTSEPPEVQIPVPYATSGSTQTKIPGISLDMLTILPRLEFMPPSATVVSGALPTGQYYEYSAKFVCGNSAAAPPA